VTSFLAAARCSERQPLLTLHPVAKPGAAVEARQGLPLDTDTRSPKRASVTSQHCDFRRLKHTSSGFNFPTPVARDRLVTALVSHLSARTHRISHSCASPAARPDHLPSEFPHLDQSYCARLAVGSVCFHWVKDPTPFGFQRPKIPKKLAYWVQTSTPTNTPPHHMLDTAPSSGIPLHV